MKNISSEIWKKEKVLFLIHILLFALTLSIYLLKISSTFEISIPLIGLIFAIYHKYRDNTYPHPIRSYLLLFWVLVMLLFPLGWHMSLEKEREKEYYFKRMSPNNVVNKLSTTVEDIISKLKDKFDEYDNISFSKKLYQQEGDSIFGNFKFCMSQAEFNNNYNMISRETNGLIRIAGVDFHINKDSVKFFHDSLYYLPLETETWDMTYYRDIGKYENGYNGKFDCSAVAKHLSKKYGIDKHKELEKNELSNSYLWDFTHKRIEVYCNKLHSKIENEYMNMVRDEIWTLTLSFTNKNLEKKAKKEEREKYLLLSQKEKLKKDEENKKKEELNKKKESFASGL